MNQILPFTDRWSRHATDDPPFNSFVLIVFVVAILFIGLIAVIFRQQARHVFTSLPLCLPFSTFGVSYALSSGSRDADLVVGRLSETDEGAFANSPRP